MTWILILTLGMGNYRSGFALHSVPGFKSQADCMSAAAAWLKQNTAAKEDGTDYWRPRALCVQQP